MQVYLDNAATTKCSKRAAEKLLETIREYYGNPSSTHKKGREAKKLLDDSRTKIASALGCESDELYFTSGGSEADNWALFSAAELTKRRGRHIISSKTEHPAVLNALKELGERGFEIELIELEKSGVIDVNKLTNALRHDTTVLSFMLVNNETGAVNDIKNLCKESKKINPDLIFHCDAVQGFLKQDFKVKDLGVDLLSISGHKLHAPKGIGALYIKKGIRLKPLLFGGGQELGLRSGTEPLPQIAAFAEAVSEQSASLGANISKMQDLKNQLIDELFKKLKGAEIVKSAAPHIISLSILGIRSEVIMNYLEASGIYVSKSSACSRGGRSHVLEAMKMSSRYIDSAIRVGLSIYNTPEEISFFTDKLKEASETLIRTG
ncbi:MAG: cysteine desulfurase family protein [Candidatus Scatomorpha sp.]